MIDVRWSLVIFLIMARHLRGSPIPAATPNQASNPEEIANLFEGDILLPPTGRGVAMRGDNVRWPNRTVPYQISSFYAATERDAIVNGMRLLENLTATNGTPCVLFREKVAADSHYFIDIVNGTGCYSVIGRNTGTVFNRTMSLQHPGCINNGTVMHELLHALGFFHEHTRPDRDSYITIIAQNIIPGQEHNFDKHNLSDADTLSTSYDYGSVMHYARDAFSVNGSSTIIPKNSAASIGQRITLSPTDILQVQRFYECQTTTTTAPTATTTVTSLRYTYVFPSSRLQFRRINGASSNYYYVVKQVIITVAGSYRFSNTGTIALISYLYRDTFDPANPSLNLMEQGTNSGNGTAQDQFIVTLSTSSSGRKRSLSKRATGQFFLVTTTQDASATGSFSIDVSGPGTVGFSDANTGISSSGGNSSGDNNKAGVIAGAVVGGVVGLICLCGICFAFLCSYLYLCRRGAVRSNPAYVRQRYTTQTSLASSIFQSGLFTGYALIDGVPRGSHTMGLSFFPQAGHVVHGKGVDHLGPFVVTGLYSLATLRMGFDKIYQGGPGGKSGNDGGPKETIQVEWSPNEQVFRGTSYSSVGTRRQQHEFILRRKSR